MLLVYLTLYLGLLAFAWFVFRRARLVTLRHGEGLIRGADYELLPRPDLIAADYARMLRGFGMALVLLAVAIPVFRLPLGAWGGLFSVIGLPMAIWRTVILMRHKRRLAATSGAVDKA